MIIPQWALFFERYPLLLVPAATELPFEVGADLTDVERVRRIVSGHRVIMATNALCLPSVVVPVGIEDGLSQSEQLIGARYHESLCLDAAEAIEQRVESITPIDPRAGSGET